MAFEIIVRQEGAKPAASVNLPVENDGVRLLDLQRALCRTHFPGDEHEAVAEIVERPDTFSFQTDTAACNVLHEAKPHSAKTNEVSEDTCVGPCCPSPLLLSLMSDI